MTLHRQITYIFGIEPYFVLMLLQHVNDLNINILQWFSYFKIIEIVSAVI